MDHAPNGYDLPWSVHGVIFAYGVGLVDNALLEPLAAACAAEGRYEFMLMVFAIGRRGRNWLAAEPGGTVLTPAPRSAIQGTFG
jgi:hypothetical protein